MDEKEKFKERKIYNAPFLRVFDYLAKEKMMNQGQFAKVIDSESGYISLLRSGKKRVGADYIARLSAEFAKHFNDEYHLNPDYIDGNSQYMIIENVPDEEILDKINRGANPDYDLMKKQQEPTLSQQPASPSAFEYSFAHETIAVLRQQVADKDAQIADLRADKERLIKESDAKSKTIDSLQARIHELEEKIKSITTDDLLRNHPFSIGVADRGRQEETTRV